MTNNEQVLDEKEKLMKEKTNWCESGKLGFGGV